MTTSAAFGLFAAAGLIGVTHGIEPDHVAGIAAVTEGAEDSRLAAVVGACFAVGHVALVAVWLVGGTVLLGASSFPPVLETVGLSVVGVVLVGLSLSLGLSAARRLVHQHDHEHGGRVHSHLHLHLNDTDAQNDGRTIHHHDHSVGSYLKIGLVGALFTLSPPVSMLVFVSVVLTNAGPALVVPVVLAYAVSITVTMGLVGYGAGRALGLARERGPRVHGALQLVVAGVVLVVALSLLSDHLPALLG